MNMKTNFTNQSPSVPCYRCRVRTVYNPANKLCLTCNEDEKVHKFLAPFEPPQGQVLDEHLFPIQVH